jgi:hypothetical protein
MLRCTPPLPIRARGVQALALLLKQLGVEALGPETMRLLAEHAALVLKGEAPCQVRGGEMRGECQVRGGEMRAVARCGAQGASTAAAITGPCPPCCRDPAIQ